MNYREYTAPDVPVTFEMIPYRTVKVDMLIATLEKHITADNRNAYHTFFVEMEGHTHNIRFGDDLPIEWQALRDYWKARGRNVIDNYDRFWECVGADVMWVWWDAYKVTRDQQIAAPPEVSEDATGANPNPNGGDPPPLPTLTLVGKPSLKSVAEQLGLTV